MTYAEDHWLSTHDGATVRGWIASLRLELSAGGWLDGGTWPWSEWDTSAHLLTRLANLHSVILEATRPLAIGPGVVDPGTGELTPESPVGPALEGAVEGIAAGSRVLEDMLEALARTIRDLGVYAERNQAMLYALMAFALLRSFHVV